jgi:transcriptional regulator with XRE-family HTH domain
VDSTDSHPGISGLDLKILRTQAELTQAELAELMGCARLTVLRLEARRHPQAEMVRRFVAAIVARRGR